jgi:hypothetical protein
MNKKEIRAFLKSEIPSMEETESFMSDEPYMSTYIGSFMSLDPCGRYHHALSPNGVSNRCARFWENLESVASELGGWIEPGEGDPTDIFFCMPKNETEEETE